MSDDNLLSLFFELDFRFWCVAKELNTATIVAREFAADTGFFQFIHSFLCGLGA